MKSGDKQLMEDFMRVRETPRGVVLEVGTVTWSGPHTPEIRWRQYRRWSTAPSSDSLKAAKEAALQDERFFKTCSSCGKRLNIGHMHDENLCQSCAERDLGIVY